MFWLFYVIIIQWFFFRANYAYLTVIKHTYTSELWKTSILFCNNHVTKKNVVSFETSLDFIFI